MRPFFPLGCRALWIVGLSAAALVASLSASEAAPPLRWGADAEGGAPYIFKDPKNPSRNIGFEVDLADALSRELNRKIEFVQYEFDSLLPGLDRGDFDFAMNGIEWTPDRAERFRLSRPYYIYKLQLVVRADERRFNSLEECKKVGGLVGTLEETAAERLLDRLDVKKKSYKGQVEPYTDLALGRVDAVLLDLPIAVYYARPNKELKFVGKPIAPGRYVIAFRKTDEALAQQVDAAIERLAQRGELKQIYQKWGIWNDDQEQLGQADNPDVEDVTAESQREWTFSAYAPLLLGASVVTVEISVASMAVAVALGLVIATMRMYGPAPVRWSAVAYVEFFRGIPVLLLMFFIYFGMPEMARLYHWKLSFNLPAELAAIVAFGLNYAAYEAEIYRAGISAVSHGQWEAAASLGMTPVKSFRRIILPQAIRTILPPMTSDFVALFKDTSLVSVIAVVDLTKEYQVLSKSSLKYLEIGAATAALYLAMSVPLGYLSRYLEKRWSKGVH